MSENSSDCTDLIDAITRAIRDYREYAQSKRQSSDLETAGAYYVAAARGSLMKFRRLPSDLTDASADSPPPKPYDFGYAMSDLLLGALCFRLAGVLTRCRYHCEQGEVIVSDVLEEPVFTTDAQVGLCHELQGDFRLVADLGNHDEEYALAADRYEKVENDLGWSMESEFEDAIQIPLELAESVGRGVSSERRNELMYLSLEERIAYKREAYPEIIDVVIETGNWESDVL